MRFHLIDRIDAYEPGQWVRGRKLTSYAEDHWQSRADDVVMPSPLVLEALCQAGTWLIMLTTGGERRAALLQVETVRHLSVVHPGEVLALEGVVESMNDEIAVLGGTASVDGRTVMEAEGIMCALIPAGDLEDPEQSARLLQTLTRA